MSEQFDKLDIPKLTVDAEHGEGCTLRAAITDLGFDERLNTLKAIQDLNAKHRLDDPSLPQLLAERYPLYSEMTGITTYSALKVVDPDFFSFNKRMYSDTLYANSRHVDSCTDLKPTK